MLTKHPTADRSSHLCGATVEERQRAFKGGNGLRHAGVLLQTNLQDNRKLACAQAPHHRGMKTLGDQAKAFREARGWKTAKMAEAVKTSRQNIESLEEHGNRIPKYIGDLALVMGRSVDELLVEAGLARRELLQMRKVDGAAWPFRFVDQKRYELLDAEERAIAQHAMAKEIESLIAARPGSGESSTSNRGGAARKAAK